MSAPHLNRRLVLEAPDMVSDGAGGFAKGWVPLGILWGSVAQRSGRETALSGAPVTRMRFRITVRAAPMGSDQRPAAQQRFREGGRIFTIEAVAEADATGRYLTCFAQEEQVV
ncbi:phage head closure protein [uncultured Sulfitobacter sp.]|uniref:phage head closure protein n=1 Tax=uncultured Sulfitobacter sp. TaxID=191468 RepID=UPI002639A769|nr:phage head closure protein [uncultured Sulfitobacter sp.]